MDVLSLLVRHGLGIASAIFIGLRHWLGHWLGLGLALGSYLGCNFASDAQLLPPTNAAPFSVTATVLPIADPSQPQPVNPVIQISFSDYPDPTTIYYPALSLGPRGGAVQYTLEISLVDKQITLRPVADLLPENDYLLTLTSELLSLSGQNLGGSITASPFSLTFHTGSQLLPPDPIPPQVTLSSLLADDGPLRPHCALSGCHTSAGGAVPVRGLDFSAAPEVVQKQLVGGVRGGIDNLLLVDPSRPELSYLLRKLLSADGGFLGIDGDPMPAPASGEPPLDHSALAAIETWIRQGAE